MYSENAVGILLYEEIEFLAHAYFNFDMHRQIIFLLSHANLHTP